MIGEWGKAWIIDSKLGLPSATVIQSVLSQRFIFPESFP